jgi:hypothetical protein
MHSEFYIRAVDEDFAKYFLGDTVQRIGKAFRFQHDNVQNQYENLISLINSRLFKTSAIRIDCSNDWFMKTQADEIEQEFLLRRNANDNDVNLDHILSIPSHLSSWYMAYNFCQLHFEIFESHR